MDKYLEEFEEVFAAELRLVVKRNVSKLQLHGIQTDADLISRLADLPVALRATGAWLLGRIQNRQAVKRLIFLVENDRSKAVRVEAIGSLGLLGGNRAVAFLVNTLRQKGDDRMRAHAARSLEVTSDDLESTVATLLEVATNKREPAGVRASALEALAHLFGHVDRRRRVVRHCIQPLIELLDDTCAEVRYFSAFALGQARANKALDKLEKLVDSEKGTCRFGSVRDEVIAAVADIRRAVR